MLRRSIVVRLLRFSEQKRFVIPNRLSSTTSLWVCQVANKNLPVSCIAWLVGWEKERCHYEAGHRKGREGMGVVFNKDGKMLSKHDESKEHKEKGQD